MKNKTFLELGVSEQVSSILQKKGYERPTPIQEELIPLFLEQDQDIIAQADTGTGKTGAFGIPLVELIDESAKRVQGLVIAPTRELAIQVATELEKYKGKKAINILQVCGGQPIGKQIDALKRIKMATVVVGTPGRIIDHMRKKRLDLSMLDYLVIDEVDEMLNFGFKEEIDTIVQEANPERRTLILSATMPPFVKKLAKNYLNDYVLVNARKLEGEKRSIAQSYCKVNFRDKATTLCRLIDSLPNFYGFIFCNTKRDVDLLAERLNRSGYAVESMHGDLNQVQRQRALRNFKERKSNIFIVTDVAARGIDVKDVSCVINYSLPQNAEIYTHRIGRTGRAGQEGMAVTFVEKRDFFRLKRIMSQKKIKLKEHTIPSPHQLLEMRKKQLIEAIESTETESYHDKMAHKILHNYSPEQALAALLKLRCTDIFEMTKR